MSEYQKEVKLTIDPRIVQQLNGNLGSNLSEIEVRLGVTIFSRGTEVVISGDEVNVNRGIAVIEVISNQLLRGYHATISEINYMIGLAKTNELSKINTLTEEIVAVTARGKKIFPRTLGQKIYIDFIKNKSLTFGIGPAGTGKTYLAVALAVAALQAKEVSRLILTRPAVEAGEKLGFLPGDLQEKVDPYLRPFMMLYTT